MPNHDIAAAMKFGELKVLLPATTQIAFSTAPTVRTLKRKLMEFSDKDPVAIGLACSIAAFYNGGRFKVLKWDRRERLYIPIVLDTTEKGERHE
jgi:hypothetical protein